MAGFLGSSCSMTLLARNLSLLEEESDFAISCEKAAEIQNTC